MPKPVKRSKGIQIDFTGVEAGGRAVPDGNYVAEVTEVEQKEGQDSGQPYLSWKYRITGPSCKGAMVYDNTSLQPQALWRLRTLLECMGFECEGPFTIDPGEMQGQTVGLEITNEEYNGKQKPRVTNFMDPEAIGDGGGDDEEEAPAKAAPAKGAKIKVGSKVKFSDDDGDEVKGIVTGIDEDNATVDVKGEEWEVELKELSLQ